MSDHKNNRKPFVYFLLTFTFSWILWLPSVLAGLLDVKFAFDIPTYTAIVVPIGAFAPLFAAVTLIVRQHGWKESWQFLRQAFDFRVKPVYFILALILPIVIHAITHYLAPIMGFEVANSLLPEDLPVPPVVLAIPYFFFILLIGGGQEEFGWRGYAQQPLQERFGVVQASLFIGVIWGFWHLPLWVMPGEPHSTYPFLAFLIMTTSISVVYAWLFNASGQKLIIVMFFHAMSNTAAPLLPYLHWEGGKPETAYWLYAGVNVLVAIIFATRIQKQTNNNYENNKNS
jgi:membrane protease YdiL (CAAX protease family)